MCHEDLLHSETVWFSEGANKTGKEKTKKGCGSVFQMSLFFKMLTQKEQTCESRVKCGDWKNVEIKMLEVDGNNPALALFIVSSEPEQLITHLHSFAQAYTTSSFNQSPSLLLFCWNMSFTFTAYVHCCCLPLFSCESMREQRAIMNCFSLYELHWRPACVRSTSV